MSTYLAQSALESASPGCVWAFDIGKASIGEAVRKGTKFLHKESLLIPAEFAETKTAAKRRRMWRTRQAHKARENWLKQVMEGAGIEVLRGRNYDSKGNWKPGEPGDERLEREFPAAGDSTCYTSCLLRIKLLRGEKLAPWQVYKALHSAIQRRGYDPNIPWKTRESRAGSKDVEDDDAGTQKRMEEFEKRLADISKGNPEYQYACYFDAHELGLWDGASGLKDRIDCLAKSTRNHIVPRSLVEKEIRDLTNAAAKFYPGLEGKADYLLYGPTGRAYASFDSKLRKEYALKEGGRQDWQGVLGQKVPRFDNRIIGKCVLIPRLNVCKIRRTAEGKLHPQSQIAAEVVFLMKLKNMRIRQNGVVRGLSASEIGAILADSKRAKFGLTGPQWKKWCAKFGGISMAGQHEEVAEPSFSGRSRFCRPALEIVKRLILSGDSPQEAYAKEVRKLDGNVNPLKGLVPDDLKFLQRMGTTWEGIYIPNQKLEAIASSSADANAAIRRLIGSQNDPIVRHRLALFSERLNELARQFGTPEFVVLEFVREDFMGTKARLEYLKFQRDRAAERAKARAEAASAGAEERSAGLKMELLKAQIGECLYTGVPLIPERLDEYCIDHIVPRAKGGPDSVMNYVLTTRRANDDKGDRTPYGWLSETAGWDAYVERVKKRALRNKKVQLLTSPDAETLVQKYTALAETAWISKLAQTIVGLRFGWPNGISNGTRRVIIISGGLTARIRRKYRLNSLLNPEAQTEEEAETKNRDDDRHHALDAMVISFIPNWARDANLTGFFRFPEGVHRELFEAEIAGVVPRNVALEKAVLEETFYGERVLQGKRYVVGREELSELATKIVSGKRTLRKRDDIKTSRIVDQRIRTDVETFLSENELTLASWDAWVNSYRLGKRGPRVEKLVVTKSKPDALDEYKDLSKDHTRQLRRGAKHQGYYVYQRNASTKTDPNKIQIEVRPVYVHESKKTVAAGIDGKSCGFFESGCLVRLAKPWRFREREYPAGDYICSSIWANRFAELRHPQFGKIGPVGLSALLGAGFQRID